MKADKNKFFDLLKERYELAARALGIKYSTLKQFGKNSLPFLMKSSNGDTYFRLGELFKNNQFCRITVRRLKLLLGKALMNLKAAN